MDAMKAINPMQATQGETQVEMHVEARTGARRSARARAGSPLVEARGGASARARPGRAAHGVRAPMPAKLRPVAREVHAEACPVCACREVRLDEVEFGGRIKLAECPRCEHRWTTPVATTRLAAERRRMAVVPRSSVDAAAQA